MLKKFILAGFLIGLSFSVSNPIAQARSNTGNPRTLVIDTPAALVGTPANDIHYWDAERFVRVGQSITNGVITGDIFPVYRDHVSVHDPKTGTVLQELLGEATGGFAALRRHCRSRTSADGLLAFGCGNYVQPEENPAAVQAIVNAK